MRPGADRAGPEGGPAGIPRGAVLGLLLLFLGCREKPPPPPPPPKAVEPEPALPAVGDVEFPEWSDVDPEKFLERPLPPEGPPLLWDFSPGKTYEYLLTQNVSQEKRDNGGPGILARQRSRGVFDFLGAGGGQAKALLTMDTEEVVVDGQTIPKELYAKDRGSLCEGKLKEDGTYDIKTIRGAMDARIFMEAILSSRLGERKIKEGVLHTRVHGAFKVDRFDCLRLECEFDFSDSKPLQSQRVRGRAVAYFAWKERHFVRASARLRSAMSAKAKTPEGKWLTATQVGETDLRFKLVESR